MVRKLFSVRLTPAQRVQYTQAAGHEPLGRWMLRMLDAAAGPPAASSPPATRPPATQEAPTAPLARSRRNRRGRPQSGRPPGTRCPHCNQKACTGDCR